MMTFGQRLAYNAVKGFFVVLFWAVVLFLFLTLWLSLPAGAQERPKAPVAKVKVRTWEKVELGTLAGSMAADYGSTRGMLGRGWQEMNPAFGPHPSNARLWGVGGAMTIGQGAIIHWGEQSRHAWVRWAARGLWAYVTEEHVRMTVHNRGLGRR